MSIPVELPDLQAKTADYTWAYLLTVRPDATPHLVSLTPQWHRTDDARAVTEQATAETRGSEASAPSTALLMVVSAGTAHNAVAGSTITLCYPPLDHNGYSLIVDGTAAVVDPADGLEGVDGIDPLPDGKALLRFSPTGAVLHRSAAPGFANSATGCANDCLPVDAATT